MPGSPSRAVAIARAIASSGRAYRTSDWAAAPKRAAQTAAKYRPAGPGWPVGGSRVRNESASGSVAGSSSSRSAAGPVVSCCCGLPYATAMSWPVTEVTTGNWTKAGTSLSVSPSVQARSSRRAAPVITAPQARVRCVGTPWACNSSSPNRRSPLVVNQSPPSSDEYGTRTQSIRRTRPSASGSERSAVAGSRNCNAKTSTRSAPRDSATAQATVRAAHSCAGGQPGR
ncbi:hypothetical protein GCM10027615_74420 [Plantactinospora veratri]